jgi:hypothetical protein
MKKFSNAIMMVLLIGAVFIFYTEMLLQNVDAVKLAESYSKNKTEADNRFFNKEIEVTGTVKVFHKLPDIRNALELNTGESEISLFCFFTNELDENKATRFSEGDTVKVIGKCTGLDKYNFVKGVKIEAKKITRTKAD